MRAGFAIAAIGIAIAGCSRPAENGPTNNAPVSTSPTTPTASTDTGLPPAEGRRGRRNRGEGFTPPSSISRADYGGRIERRFRRLDKNQDNKIEGSELPGGRGERMVRRYDTNRDGSVDGTEWSAFMLKRFDRKDVNQDGTLTSDERGKRGERGGRRRGAQAGQMDQRDADPEADAAMEDDEAL